MNKNEIDNFIKSELENLKAPEELKNKIHKDIKQMKKHSLLKRFQQIAAVVLIGTIGITAYAGITGNLKLDNLKFSKLSQNYNENAVEVNETIDNEYLTLTLESVAGDEAYIALGYTINLKEKALNEFEDVEYDERDGYHLNISNEVFINLQKIEPGINIRTHVDKISETEYTYFQIINIMDFEEKSLDFKICLNDFYIDNSYRNKSNEIEINKQIQFTVNVEKNSNFVAQEQVINDNVKIIIENVANTKFETYIQAKFIIENLTWEDYGNDYVLFKNYEFIIIDENNEIIPAQTYLADIVGKTIYKKDNNGQMVQVNLADIKDTDIVKVEDNYRILMAEPIENSKIKILPVKTRLYNDKTNEEKEYYDKAVWYPVVAGDTKYTAESPLGGTLEIEKITIDDENITFYYNRKGYSITDTSIIIRRKNGKMNYIHPTRSELAGVNGDENKVCFAIEDWKRSGLNITSEFDNLNTIMSELEFTMLFGKISEKIGEGFEFTVPVQSKETAKFNNIKINDIQQEIEEVSNKNINITKKYEEEILSKTEENNDYKIIEIEEENYHGYLTVIYDPSRIKVISTDGKYLTDISEENNSFVAINGGGHVFTEEEYEQTYGIAISDNEVVASSEYTHNIIGFNQDDRLILGEYPIEDLKELGIRDAVTWSPYLIQGGMALEVGDYGKAPRTAIGQREDGIVLFLVIDGDRTKGEGATLNDLINIFQECDAINAANLDGGTSTSMTVHKSLVNNPTSIIGEEITKEITTAFILEADESDDGDYSVVEDKVEE